MKGTISLTFGDRAESHAGMEMIGEEATGEFSTADLKELSDILSDGGYETELINLNDALPEMSDKIEEASVLVVRKYVSDPDALMNEHMALEFDTKAKMRGVVKNKIARHNLCYGDFSQEPEYEEGKGRVINFKDVPILGELRDQFESFCSGKVEKLMCELNYYYDLNKCGIGWHGDTERRIVICVRLGETMPLQFQWFHNWKPLGTKVELSLNHGDIYIMSGKAVGYDWKETEQIYA
jgi:alkylated DNA repair dioxygenase AlkB